MHPEENPVPLADAKRSPKMWRKLKNLEGLSVRIHENMQITYVTIAPFVFPAAGQLPETEVSKHHDETCFHKISNRGL